VIVKRIAFAFLLFVATTASARVRIPDWVQSAAAMQVPSYPEKTRGVTLLDEWIVTPSANGELRTVRRRVDRVLGTSGRDLGFIAVPFGGETKLKRLQGWSIAASGQYHVPERDAVESAAFDGELYADQKIKVLRVPAAEPGSVVAFEYELAGRPYAMQDMWRFQSDLPVRRARYVLSLPEGWSHEARWMNAAGVEPQRVGTQLVWELSDVAAIEDERGAPPIHAVGGYVGITFVPASGAGHRTWNDVARWYQNLAEARRAVSPAIETKARALTASSPSAFEKIAALAKFAQRDIRYVAIEVGIGGYQPHQADAVLSTLYGDCKDKVTLLSAMLRAIGIESHYVLVNSERGVVEERFPSLFGFNHAIIAVRLPADAPKGLHAASNGLLFFDPTHPYVPAGELPPSLQKSRGLVVKGDGGELVELPSHPPAASRLVRTAKLTLMNDGTLEGEVHEIRSGSIAANIRAILAGSSETERRQLIERMLTAHLDEHALRDLVIENGDDPAKDLLVRYHLSAPRYARRKSGMMLVRPRVLGSKPEALLELEERKHDYVTEGPSQHIDEIDITVPPGVLVDELPESRKLETPAVTYHSASKFEQGVLRYRRQYELHQYVVPREKLGDLNKAFAEILADERGSAVLVTK
jgi:hypothetical protein